MCEYGCKWWAAPDAEAVTVAVEVVIRAVLTPVAEVLVVKIPADGFFFTESRRESEEKGAAVVAD